MEGPCAIEPRTVGGPQMLGDPLRPVLAAKAELPTGVLTRLELGTILTRPVNPP